MEKVQERLKNNEGIEYFLAILLNKTNLADEGLEFNISCSNCTFRDRRTINLFHYWLSYPISQLYFTGLFSLGKIEKFE